MDPRNLRALNEHGIGGRVYVRAYSGRPGCGCGCRGTYYEDARNIRRILNRIARAAVRTGNRAGQDDGILYAEDGKRYYWAFPAKGV